jgi:hypothetical protein
MFIDDVKQPIMMILANWYNMSNKLLKQVKEHSVQQAQFLSSNHHVVLPWCTQARAFIELLVDVVNSQGFNGLKFPVLLFIRNLLKAKMQRQQKTVTFFNS